MGIENLRKIVIRGDHKKSFVFLKFMGGEDGADIWEKNGKSYERKGAYDVVDQNHLGYEFFCNEGVRREFLKERTAREKRNAFYFGNNERRVA